MRLGAKEPVDLGMFKGWLAQSYQAIDANWHKKLARLIALSASWPG